MGSLRLPGLFCLAILAIAAAYLFVPASVGGRTTYATTVGNSMEPEFETGDLVVLRRDGHVKVGDIAGYRSGATGQVVVHRVIAESEGRLTFKGDNNWWTDSYQPTQQEVVGRLWIHMGGAGEKLNGLHPTWVLAGIAGVMGIVLKDTGTSKPPRRRRTRGGTTFAGQGPLVVLLTLLAVAAVSGLLAVWAYRAPNTVAVDRLVTGRQSGTFNYEGAALNSPIYPDGMVNTGDPIFVDIAPVVKASFAYHLDAPNAQNVEGTIRLIAVARGANGFEQTAELIPLTGFSGTDASIETEIDLAPTMVLFAALQEAIGNGPSYWTVAISAEVFVQGSIEGRLFQAPFSPFFTLRVTPPNEIFVETSLTRDFESAPPAFVPKQGTAFFPVQEVTVTVTDVAPATMGLVFADVRVDRVRVVAGITAAASVLAALTVLVLIALALRSPAAQILARYGSRLVQVEKIHPPATNAVTMSTMSDLVRVADRYQSIILWLKDDDENVFTVRENHTDFVYRDGA
ncbi:MAG: signal peptidase I [bacterium]